MATRFGAQDTGSHAQARLGHHSRAPRFAKSVVIRSDAFGLRPEKAKPILRQLTATLLAVSRSATKLLYQPALMLTHRRVNAGCHESLFCARPPANPARDTNPCE